jgi:prophage regulatory protein
MSLASKILSPHELRTLKGIRFSRMHIWRLTKAGKFPAPIKLGDGTNGFLEAEIDAWIDTRVAERDERSAAA